jgi:glycolate oxidase iron-sulfur subunit
MQTQLAPQFIDTHDGNEAARILGKCVHCGFCTATCPTYQLLGNELDGPRGRIYLIKQIAEGQAVTEKTRLHLDRCLTCRNCETTCPSGVQYGQLIDIGRKWAEQSTAPRKSSERLTRWILKEGLTRPTLFNSAMALGRLVRPLLPSELKRKVPVNGVYVNQIKTGNTQSAEPVKQSVRSTMLILEGCVQPGMLPNINSATRRVLSQVGIDLIDAPKAGCCGALRYHLNDQAGGLEDARRNIDAWWPYVGGNNPITAIVMTASGCGVMVKDYGHLLAEDAQYAAKAKRISELTKDLAEILPDFTEDLIDRLGCNPKSGVVYHPPCTLQHGQKIRGKVEGVLESIGVPVRLCADSHLCCGSAGTYSVLQPVLSSQLRQQKLDHLHKTFEDSQATAVVSANIGCITHLQQDAMPVLHWVEIVDQLLTDAAKKSQSHSA